MIRRITQKIDKKYRFAAHALVYAGLLYSHSSGIIPFQKLNLLVAMLLVTGFSVFLASLS
ncbi:MAG: hypothetical protein KatS3mg101_0449 [Patescibacteria group bacterium]|nr:MAG: hypothetical protein KatS3mg101_0449 [Patescibacteria group bacterium]